MNILGKRELIRPSAIQAPETGKRFRNIDYNSLFIGKDIVIVLAPAGLMRIMRIYQIILSREIGSLAKFALKNFQDQLPYPALNYWQR